MPVSQTKSQHYRGRTTRIPRTLERLDDSFRAAHHHKPAERPRRTIESGGGFPDFDCFLGTRGATRQHHSIPMRDRHRWETDGETYFRVARYEPQMPPSRQPTMNEIMRGNPKHEKNEGERYEMMCAAGRRRDSRVDWASIREGITIVALCLVGLTGWYFVIKPDTFELYLNRCYTQQAQPLDSAQIAENARLAEQRRAENEKRSAENWRLYEERQEAQKQKETERKQKETERFQAAQRAEAEEIKAKSPKNFRVMSVSEIVAQYGDREMHYFRDVNGLTLGFSREVEGKEVDRWRRLVERSGNVPGFARISAIWSSTDSVKVVNAEELGREYHHMDWGKVFRNVDKALVIDPRGFLEKLFD